MRKKKTYEDHQRDGEIAINIAALALSKQAIKEEIKAKGERLTLVKPAEINARAKVYLEQHPGLWRLAWERAWHSGQIDESVGVILREIYRRRSVPELYVTPSWPEPLPERGVRRKKKKEPPKEEPPKGVVMLSLAIAGMSFVGILAHELAVSYTEDAKSTTENNEENPAGDPPIKGCRLLNAH